MIYLTNGNIIPLPRGLKAVYQPKGEAAEYARLALNVYLSCEHACAYCYAAQAIRKTKEQFFQRPAPRPNFLANLRHDCAKLAPFAADLPPIHISFIGDPFQPCEDEYHCTADAIGMLKRNGLCVQLLTKAADVAGETMRLFDERDWFGVTLTSWRWTQKAPSEPSAGIPSGRLVPLARARRSGLNTWVSVEPILDIEEIERVVIHSRLFADHYKFGPLNYQVRGYELADAAREVRRVMAMYGYEEGAMERGRRTYHLKRSLKEAEVDK